MLHNFSQCWWFFDSSLVLVPTVRSISNAKTLYWAVPYMLQACYNTAKWIALVVACRRWMIFRTLSVKAFRWSLSSRRPSQGCKAHSQHIVQRIDFRNCPNTFCRFLQAVFPQGAVLRFSPASKLAPTFQMKSSCKVHGVWPGTVSITRYPWDPPLTCFEALHPDRFTCTKYCRTHWWRALCKFFLRCNAVHLCSILAIQQMFCRCLAILPRVRLNQNKKCAFPVTRSTPKFLFTPSLRKCTTLWLIHSIFSNEVQLLSIVAC